jgi:putative ABC transport system permease protein
MAQVGAEIGERVHLRSVGEDETDAFEVVGVAMVTDGAEPNVGHGAVVTPEGMDSIERGTLTNAVLAVAVADEADRDRTLAALRDRFPSLVDPFPVPTSLLNAERVADLPLLLALVAAALAAITFAHALVVSVRRSLRELAVCRVLGFTHGQVRSAVSTQASILAGTAVVLGVPLGVIGARWGWRILADAFGVVTEPRVPLAVAAACVVAVVALANLAAVPSARSAARRPTAEILRSE